MILLPENYESLELSKYDRLLINMMKNKYDNTYLFLISVNPVGSVAINMLISQKSVCFIEKIEIDNATVLPSLLPALIQGNTNTVEKIYRKLLNHKYFNIKQNEQIFLKIPFTYKLYLPLFVRADVMNFKFEENIKKYLNENCIFKDDLSSISSDPNKFMETIMSNPRYPYSKNWKEFDTLGLDLLIHQIAPEYMIPRYSSCVDKIEESEVIYNSNSYDYDVKAGDVSVGVLRLDAEQINIINNLKKGNQLILACAGSGKSVLLISRCFKAASIHENEDFLITCFNRNLSNLYDWKITVSGFKNRKVKCVTFYKLCQDLLLDLGLSFDPEDFDGTFERAKQALEEGRIKKRYYGIFIDEIQIFKPEWYEFCYNLRKNKNGEEHFFVICGDISQNINSNIKQGKAPWQGNPKLPKYTGKSLRIEKNYRNCVEINSYMNRFTEVSKRYFDLFGIEVENKEDLFLRGKSERKGNKPQVIISDRMDEASDVVKCILHLNEEKKVPLSEIAVLMFNKQYRPEKYYIHSWIKDKLNVFYIDNCDLISLDGSYGTLYGERKGVSLSTIESALGLDFDAVIVCGLKPLGSYYGTKKEKAFEKDNPHLDECKRDFFKNINTLYTACTRARDHLYIVLTEDDEKSLYSKILIESLKE